MNHSHSYSHFESYDILLALLHLACSPWSHLHTEGFVMASPWLVMFVLLCKSPRSLPRSIPRLRAILTIGCSSQNFYHNSLVLFVGMKVLNILCTWIAVYCLDWVLAAPCLRSQMWILYRKCTGSWSSNKLEVQVSIPRVAVPRWTQDTKNTTI